jgi:predicted GNAT family N-acyltransferase
MPGSDEPSNRSPVVHEIREIHADDDVQQFCCDEEFEPLKEFLAVHSHKYHSINISKTYVAVIKRRVIAYISLCCSQIHFDSPPTDLHDIPYRSYPAVKIGQLAVVKNFRNQGFGGKLVSLAMASVKENIQRHVGCRFLLIDSHKDAVSWYKEKQGFSILQSKKNIEKKFPMMFLDIGKL